MTFEQTVEIPENRRLTIEVPREVPVGRTILTYTPAFVKPEPGIDDITRELRELCKNSTLTVDRFLEMRRDDMECEDEKFRRMFQDEGDTD
jgi:hypothetical protein